VHNSPAVARSPDMTILSARMLGYIPRTDGGNAVQRLDNCTLARCVPFGKASITVAPIAWSRAAVGNGDNLHASGHFPKDDHKRRTPEDHSWISADLTNCAMEFVQKRSAARLLRCAYRWVAASAY
jgi:hypothetical protein